MAVWEWHWDFYKIAQDKHPNDGHKAIAKFQEYCAKNGNASEAIESMLVTQNIDDLHNREIRESSILSNTEDRHCNLTESNRVAFTPHIYEIHGNTHYMHCSDEEAECGSIFYRCPSLQEFEDAAAAAPEPTITSADGITQNFCLIPKCRECGAVMKPHSMFFDENYSERYYRRDTVMEFVDSSDCLIVVGTALATNLACQIV